MKKIICLVLVLLALCAGTVVAVSADSGPQPTIILQFQPADEEYCVTLLYDKNAYGDNGFNGNNEIFGDRNGTPLSWQKEITEKFNNYEDADGFKMASDICRISANSSGICYFFGSPEHFKLLVYFPDSDTFVISEPTSRYAFRTRYTVTVSQDSGIDLVGSANAGLNELFPANTLDTFVYFFISLVITIIVELLIGLCFRFTRGKQILTIILTNIVTLPLMTWLINVVNPPVYGSIFSFPYAFFEIGVTAVEAAVYCWLLPKFAKGRATPRWLVIIYAVVANLATYAIAAFFPGLEQMILNII